MLDPIKMALRHGINGMCKSLDNKPDQQHPAPPCAIPCKLCREGAPAAITAYLRAKGRDIEAAAVERAAKEGT